MTKAITTAIAGICGLAMAIAATSCGGTNDARTLDDRPEQVVEGRNAYNFKSVATMTATSDLVVRTTVVDIQPGRWDTGEPSEDGSQAREITLEIDETYLDKCDFGYSTITIDEWGWMPDGVGYQYEGITWSQEADTGFYFLGPGSENLNPGKDRHFGLMSPQARITITADGLEPTADDNSEIFEEITSMDEAALISTIEQAAEDFQAGNLKPVPPAHESGE